MFAHLSNNIDLINAFNNNLDIHSKTASDIFKVDIDKVYEYNEENTMLIEGTSGTTGVPKGVEICGRMINTTYASHSDSFIKFEHGDTYYDLMNNSLAYGATSAIMTALRGVHTVFRPGFTMDPYDDIMKYDVNQVIAGPVHVKNLNKHIENGDPVPKVKNWVSGGAPLDRKLEATVNKVDEQGVVHTDDGKPIVTQGYGATENQGVIAYEAADCYEYGAMGIPLLMENVGVFKTDTDEELGYNQEGEICISGDSIMNRYFDNPEETNKVLITHSDGTRWLHMKDLGSIDENGHLIFADRIKNIFQRNGMNVHPAKVTDFIKSIDIVDDCIVTGVQHPEEQCVPVAFIKLRSDIDNLEDAIDYINAACYKNLEESSIPYEIRFVENIPVNGGGKPDVRYLLETCGIDYYDQKAQRKRILSIEKVNTFKL
jgi:long-chain acyl-CoA synthetase